MRQRRLTTIFLLLSVCYLETGAVMCNDSCAVVADVVDENGKSLHPKLPEGLKECSNDTLKECGAGQVCVTTPVEFTALVMENGTTLQNGTVKFVYSSCSGSGNTTVDCSNIGEEIAKQFNGSEYVKKLQAFNEEFAKMQRQMKDMSSRLSKYFERMKEAMGFGSGWPTWSQDDDWVMYTKRDDDAAKDHPKAKEATETTKQNSPTVRFYSMVLSGCDESTIRTD